MNFLSFAYKLLSKLEYQPEVLAMFSLIYPILFTPVCTGDVADGFALSLRDWTTLSTLHLCGLSTPASPLKT